MGKTQRKLLSSTVSNVQKLVRRCAIVFALLIAGSTQNDLRGYFLFRFLKKKLDLIKTFGIKHRLLCESQLCLIIFQECYDLISIGFQS